jgi:pimeloyl-ACP methyl ester carboxylesterase
MTQPEKNPPAGDPLLLRRGLEWLGLRTIPLHELRAKYETPESRYMEIDGTRIHYRMEGSGPTVVLLHGVLAQLQTWDGWVQRLKHRYRFFRMDVPGFGLTGPVASGNYTPQYAVEMFEKVRIALGEERFHLVGNSLGGFFGWNYAAQYPQHVDRLILIDPLGYPQRMPPVMFFSLLPVVRTLASFWVPRPFVAEGVRQVYGDPARIDRATVDRYHQLLLREGNRASMLAFFELGGTYFNRNAASGLWDAIPRIRARTLLMWGEKDRWIPVRQVKRWKRDLPDIEVKIYPGVGHVPMEEIPEQTAADADAFLSAP